MKIFVHIHIYYIEMWDSLRNCLHNIEDYNYELYITLVEHNYDLEQKIKEFKANSHILIVENRGFDVAPFIYCLKQINLDDFDYLIKLHTKRDLPKIFTSKEGPVIGFTNFYPLLNGSWRKYLLEFISSKKTFEKCLKSFENDLSLGMINSRKLLLKNSHKITGFEQFPKKFKFVAGTMFIARAKIFKEIQELNLITDDFPISIKRNNRTLAHDLERIFGAVVYKNNLKIKDVYSCRNIFYQFICFFIYIFYHMSRFLFQYKTNEDNIFSVKIFKIKIFKKIYEEK